MGIVNNVFKLILLNKVDSSVMLCFQFYSIILFADIAAPL